MKLSGFLQIKNMRFASLRSELGLHISKFNIWQGTVSAHGHPDCSGSHGMVAFLDCKSHPLLEPIWASIFAQMEELTSLGLYFCTAGKSPSPCWSLTIKYGTQRIISETLPQKDGRSAPQSCCWIVLGDFKVLKSPPISHRLSPKWSSAWEQLPCEINYRTAEKTASWCSLDLAVFCKQPGKMTSGVWCQSECEEEFDQNPVQI